MTNPENEYQYIDDQRSLDEFCKQASTAPVLALDTEFVRTRTLHADLGLIQANDGQSMVLIDPLVDLDLEPFWQLLTNENIVKVLHSCHEDLEVFKIYSGRMPTPLFDTQIAGQFLFQGKVLGFGAAVLQEVGVELDKGEARTNWLKRPLSPQQLVYAANDVKYLLPLYHSLNDKLKARGIDQYNIAEANYKVELKAQDKNLDLLYLDFGNAWQLKPRELAVLQELSAWRLEVAKKRNLALGFVVKDASLFAIAQRRPSDIHALRSIAGINPHEVRLHGSAILSCVERGEALDSDACPVKVPRLTDFPIYKQAYKQLKQLLTKAGEQHDLPIEMLATKKQLNQWVKWKWQLPHAETPDFIGSWRSEILSDALAVWDKSFGQLDVTGNKD